METKQTAVNWLIEKLNQCEPMYSGIQSLEHKQYLDQLVELAKQMEKEQIIDAVSGSLPDDNRIVTEAILAAKKVDSNVGLLPNNQDIKMFCLGAKWMRDKILNK